MPVERKCPMCGKLTKRPFLNWFEGTITNRKIMRGCMFCYLEWKKVKLKEDDPNEDSDDIL